MVDRHRRAEGPRPPLTRARRRARVIAASGTVLLAVLLAMLFHRIIDATRGSPLQSLRMLPAMHAAPAVSEPRFAEAMTALAGAQLVSGHAIELHVTGAESFRSLFVDLRAAQRSITFQSYYCGPGVVADSVVAILTERARAGVRVLFLADGFGCRRFVHRYGPSLGAAGVELAVLRPVRWYTLHKAQHRSHARLVIVDGGIGHTGGFGIDDKWLTADGVGWRETNARFRGPAVAQGQGAFFGAWAEATGELVAGHDFFPGASPRGKAPPGENRDDHPVGAEATPAAGTIAAIQFAGPGLGTTPFERMLFLAIAGARERLYIANPYFVPNAAIRSLLGEAVARGIDVRVLTAGARTDLPSTWFASRAYYSQLLAAGVRIFEYEPTMMHAKTFVVDGVFAAVGSMNLDNRSLRLNDELNLLVYDAETGGLLERIFAADLARATEVTIAVHDRRPRRYRLLELGARIFAPLL